MFDSPIFCIFVLLFFRRYFMSTQINNRLSADRDFALGLKINLILFEYQRKKGWFENVKNKKMVWFTYFWHICPCLVLFGEYFISAQISNRLSADGVFALVWTEKIEYYFKIKRNLFLDKSELTFFLVHLDYYKELYYQINRLW